MRDLLLDPCWKPEELGHPLPESPHAVSVSLPLWEHVIGYEEEDPAVLRKLRCGYPRFFLPPLLEQLLGEACRRFARPGEGCLVYPSRHSAERCLKFVHNRVHSRARLDDFGSHGLCVVTFSESIRRTVREYWRYAGETVSTRLADAALQLRHPDQEIGAVAKAVVRRRLARLAGVTERDVYLFPSGMAAVFAVHRMLSHVIPGKHSAQLDFPYVDVLKVQQEFGEGVEFYPVANRSAIAGVKDLAAAGRLCGVFCETPSNPLLRSVALSEIQPALRAAGVPLIVDDTVATVAAVDALRFADLTTSSLTKSFSGVGDVMAGAVTLNPTSPFHDAFRAFLDVEMLENDIFWCEDAVVLEHNSRDFPKRVRRAGQNAAALAAFLSRQPQISQVFHPSLHPDGLEEIRRPGGQSGCLLSFTLADESKAQAVYDALRVCKGPSLGANFTLVCPYTLLAHYRELPWAESCGVSRNLIRVSTGLEESDDLIARFAEALRQA
jgi:cystathionine gamma-synthase